MKKYKINFCLLRHINLKYVKPKKYRKYNIFNQATGEDSFPPVPESYERGGVYVNIRTVYDYSDNCQLNCIYLELHT